jgi:hypothetical protein
MGIRYPVGSGDRQTTPHRGSLLAGEHHRQPDAVPHRMVPSIQGRQSLASLIACATCRAERGVVCEYQVGSGLRPCWRAVVQAREATEAALQREKPMAPGEASQLRRGTRTRAGRGLGEPVSPATSVGVRMPKPGRTLAELARVARTLAEPTLVDKRTDRGAHSIRSRAVATSSSRATKVPATYS